MEPARPRPVRSHLVLVVCLALTASCGSPEVSPLENGMGPVDPPTPRGLTITHIDVGQGDSTLIEGPEKTMLIDAGDEGMGDDRVGRRLQERYLGTLDFVVTTHPHADHVGGMDEVLASVDAVEGVWDNGDSTSSQAFDRYKAAAAATSGGRRTITVGHVFDLGAGAKATCVAVNGDLIDGSSVAGATETNDRSVVLLVEWGDFRYVIGGDLGGYDTQYVADVETSLAPLLGDVDVLRVSHHGSRYSTNPVWLNALRPEVAVISLGDGNDYGHPSTDTIARLSGQDASVTIPPPDVYLTQKGAAPSPYAGAGDIVIEARRDSYRIESQTYDAVAR